MKEHKTADCVVVGVRWKQTAGEARDAAARPLPRGRRGRLRRLGGDRRPQPRRDRSAASVPLLDESSDRRFSEPNRWGTEGPRGDAAAARARRRGALRQGAGQPLPPRHEADPLPAGQGSGPVHVARGEAAAARRRPHGRIPARPVNRARERAREEQREPVRSVGRHADAVRPRVRLRPEHVAPRRAGVRGRVPDRPLRPRRRRPLRPRPPTAERSTTRSSGYADDVLEICRELELRDVIFVGHSVSAMIGVLAALRGAGAVREARPRRPLAALHRRRRLRRRVHARGHRGAARVARQQLPRLVGGHARP